MGTYNYQLAKFLGKLLDDFIPSDHFTKDTFSFVEEIKTESITSFFLSRNQFVYKHTFERNNTFNYRLFISI